MLLGFFAFTVSTIVILRTLFLHFTGESDIGTTSLFLSVLIFGSMNSLILAFLGLYIGAIHKEVKRRPHFIIDEKIGFKSDHKN